VLASAVVLGSAVPSDAASLGQAMTNANAIGRVGYHFSQRYFVNTESLVRQPVRST
jgi:hypothetical protein